VINALMCLGFESSLIHYAEYDGTRHVAEGIKFVLRSSWKVRMNRKASLISTA
jgi:hypothetical protein